MIATASPKYDAIRIPGSVLLVAFMGAMAALAGAYWDDAWHTDRGRDEFFIAPHIAIYAGVASAGGALALGALLAARRHGASAAWRHKPLALSVVGVAVTLASAPIDNAWHLAFGRDAVIWSPPHMLGIVGTLALGAAILAEIARRRSRLTVIAGALVLASAGFVTVEYETDVPQFDEVFYLPVLGLATAIGLTLVRAVSEGRWPATRSAAVYTLFIAAVGGVLSLLDFPPPALPLLIPAALTVDLGARHGWHPAVAAAAYTAALHAAYVPARNVLGEGVRFGTADVLTGGGLTWLATLVVFAVAAGARVTPRPGPGGHGAAAAALLLLFAAPAPAHDPGQGEPAGTVAVRITVIGGVAAVDTQLPRHLCATTQPAAVVARRAGEVHRAPLMRRGCQMSGRLRLPGRGRWFVYTEMRRGGRVVESWLPVSVRDGRGQSAARERYAYFARERPGSVLKTVGGAALYGVMVALLYATFVLVRGSGDQARGDGRAAAGL